MKTYFGFRLTKKGILLAGVLIVAVLLCVWYVIAVRVPTTLYRPVLSVQTPNEGEPLHDEKSYEKVDYPQDQARQAFLTRVEESRDCIPLGNQDTLSESLISLNHPELGIGGGYRKGYFNKGYYKDDHCVYQSDWWVLRGADVHTIKPDGDSYAHDAYAVFSGSTYMEKYDAGTFKVLTEDYGLVKDKNGVYVMDAPVAGADPQTFEHIAGRYWRTKDNVYFVGMIDYPAIEKIDGADPETMAVYDDTLALDKNHLYLNGVIVERGDRSSLKRIWGGDGEYAYYVQVDTGILFMERNGILGTMSDRGKIVVEADPSTFTYIGCYYTKDAQHVYYKDTVVPGADPDTFMPLDTLCRIWKDHAHIYEDGHQVVDEGDALRRAELYKKW